MTEQYINQRIHEEIINNDLKQMFFRKISCINNKYYLLFTYLNIKEDSSSMTCHNKVCKDCDGCSKFLIFKSEI